MDKTAFNALLKQAVDKQASDVHVAPGRPPAIRIDGELNNAADAALQASDIESVIKVLIDGNKRAQEHFEKNSQADFSYALDDGTRFRVNVYRRLGNVAVALRLIPKEIKNLEQLGLPPQLVEFAEMKQGFVLVVGPAGHGKSTTLAALIDHINQTRREHIITIEDPIEYQFQEKNCLIDQREIGQDALNFAQAARATLRQDPNVIMIGELRDLETMSTAITIAETGHLVFGTLHTNDAAQTVERLIDSFPPVQQRQVRSQLSVALSGVISQRLLPRQGGGRIPAIEIMVATPAIRNVIREGTIHQIPGIIQTNAKAGMQTLDSHLQYLIDKKLVDLKAARSYLLSAQGKI